MFLLAALLAAAASAEPDAEAARAQLRRRLGVGPATEDKLLRRVTELLIRYRDLMVVRFDGGGAPDCEAISMAIGTILAEEGYRVVLEYGDAVGTDAPQGTKPSLHVRLRVNDRIIDPKEMWLRMEAPGFRYRKWTCPSRGELGSSDWVRDDPDVLLPLLRSPSPPKRSSEEVLASVIDHVRRTNPHVGPRDALAHVNFEDWIWSAEAVFVSPFDVRIDLEPAASSRDVRRYLRRGTPFPAVVLGVESPRHWVVLDGAHRLWAARARGDEAILAWIGTRPVPS